MTLRPEVEALLQGALDDSLTPEERDRLDRLMQESLEVKGRAEHLKQLTQLLDSLGPAEPPAGLTEDVLAKISSSKQPTSTARVASFPVMRREVRHSAPRGDAMNKKWIWTLAAAAVIVLAAATYFSNQPANEGTEATIGAAKRAVGPQIAEKDVILGDTSAQEFLQSETFAQLLKDPDSVKVLSDAEMRNRLSDAALLAALRDKDLSAALSSYGPTCPGCARVLQDNNFHMAIRHDAFAQALRTPQFIAALSDNEVLAALKKNDIDAALRVPALSAAIRNTELAAALKSYGPTGCRGCQEILSNQDFHSAVRNSAFVNAVRSAEVMAAFRNPQLAAALADARLAAALRSGAFQNALRASGFSSAVRSQRFAQELAANARAQY